MSSGLDRDGNPPIFASQEYSPKEYINGLIRSKPEDIPIEKYLMDVEMRLHVQADAMASGLHDLSLKASTGLPAAARELIRIKQEVSLLQMNIHHAMKSVQGGHETDGSRANGDRAHTQGPATVAVFQELEQMQVLKALTVKAKSMLEEASNLSSMFNTIDSMLQSDDLKRLADSLARFRKSLEVVSRAGLEPSKGDGVRFQDSDLPIYKVDQLEDRVFDLAVGMLDSSLRLQNGERCRQACAVLHQIDREGLIGQRYCSIRSIPLVELWDTYSSSTPYASWVGTFYDEVGRAVAAECQWCKTYLDGYCGDSDRGSSSVNLVFEMLGSFFRRIEVPCKARIAGATAGATISPLQSIEAMEQVIACVGSFIDTLLEILGTVHCDIGEKELNGDMIAGEPELLKVLSQPYDDMLLNYPRKEASHMKSLIEHAMGKKPLLTQAHGLATDVTLMDDIFGVVSEALQRCQATSQGTELPKVVDAIDMSLAKFCDDLFARLIEYLSKDLVSSDLSSMFSLLGLTKRMEEVLSRRLEAVIGETIADVMKTIAIFRENPLSFKGSASLNYRRAAWKPEILNSVDNLAQDARAGRKTLKKLSESLQNGTEKVEAMLLSGFERIIRLHFDELGDAITLHSPTSPTSSYPLQYIINVGEQLMLLPQLLETGVIGDSVGDEMGELVPKWLEKLCGSTCSTYLKQLEGLNSLDTAQSLQISADLEYLSNILNSLDCEMPVELSAWQTALVTDEDSARALLEGLGDGNRLAADTMRMVFSIKK
jgi:hypothetical protein